MNNETNGKNTILIINDPYQLKTADLAETGLLEEDVTNRTAWRRGSARAYPRTTWD